MDLGLRLKLEAKQLLFVERGLVLKHTSELYIYGQTQKNNELLITFCGNAFSGVFLTEKLLILGNHKTLS